MTVWKEIAGFEDYEISADGQIRRRVGGRGAVAGKNLKWHLQTSTGYPDVRLRKNGKAYSLSVHRLVAAAFLGPRPEGHQIRHLDGNKFNASASNLAYGTPKQNGEDKVAHGRSSKGEKNVKAKLTSDVVLDIYNGPRGKDQVTRICEKLDISPSSVYRIWSGYRWSHVTASNRAIDRAVQ